MDANFLSPKVRVRTDVSGWGSFALEAIAAGETVAAFGGRCASRAELDEMTVTERFHSVQIDDDLFLVGDVDAPGEAITHSCAPNCGVLGGVLVVALRDIAAGEAVSYDYGMTMGCDINEFECNCGQSSCRHKVTGRDWLLPELQVAYRGHFSPYLAKRIAALVNSGASRRQFTL